MFKATLFAIATLTAVLNTFDAAAAASKVLPKLARNMTPGMVRNIYSDHTWRWDKGGAYFAKDGTFLATTGSGKDRSTAAGRWLVTPGGRLCFRADWSQQTGLYRNVMTCFNHAAYKGHYYQAKGLSGKWYIIKSGTHKITDMLNKIVPGDQVACQFLAAEKKLKNKLSNSRAAKAAKLKKCEIASSMNVEPSKNQVNNSTLLNSTVS